MKPASDPNQEAISPCQVCGGQHNFGLHPETILRLLKHVLASGKVVSFDFAEVSPRFDSNDNTAKLAAVFVYALVNTLAPSRS
jgi:arginase family enzyme